MMMTMAVMIIMIIIIIKKFPVKSHSVYIYFFKKIKYWNVCLNTYTIFIYLWLMKMCINFFLSIFHLHQHYWIEKQINKQTNRSEICTIINRVRNCYYFIFHCYYQLLGEKNIHIINNQRWWGLGFDEKKNDNDPFIVAN